MALNPTRSAFLKTIERPRAAADLTVTGDRFRFQSEAGETVPGIVARPPALNSPVPVVICLHGTGGNKEGMRAVMQDVVRHGCIGVAIDGRHHGERAHGQTSSAAYQDAILQTWKTGVGRPFLYDTVWDVMRLIDVVSGIDGADASRVGLLGVSKGGMEGYLAAAADERIKAVVPCIAAQSFRWGIENDGWHARVSTFQRAFDTAANEAGVKPDAEFLKRFYTRVAPGIFSKFDGPAMLPLIANRGLYLVNGELDPRCPLPGLEECIAAAKTAYSAAPDHFRYVIQPKTAHKVNADAMSGAVAWITHFL